MHWSKDRVGLLRTLKQPFTSNYPSREQTDTNIRWLNVKQVKYCSRLFASRPGCPLISNLSPKPSDNTSWWTHCMEFHAAFSRCVVNPYCTLEQTSLQRALQRVSEGDRSAEGEGVDCGLALTLKTKERGDWLAGCLSDSTTRTDSPICLKKKEKEKKGSLCARWKISPRAHTVSARFAMQVKFIKWM